MEPCTSPTPAVQLQPMASAEADDDAPTDPRQPPEQYPAGLRFVVLTLGLILSIFLAALDSSILATAIPKITDQFGTVRDVAWYSTAYSITNAAFQSTWGRAYKFFPLMWTFLLAVALFELGNVICALAQDSTALILGRVVAGLGGGGVMAGCFIFIALSAKPQYRAAYMGILGVTFGCASVTGPLLGGFLTDGPGWRWCFWISLPIGTFAAIIMALSFKPPAAAHSAPCSLKEKLLSLDLGGACLVSGSITCFILAMQRAGVASSWQNWRVVTSLSASALLLLLFIANERFMGGRAMIQGHLFKKRNVTSYLTYQFFLAGLFFPLTYVLPIQFQSVGNASATQSGVRLIPLILGVSVFTMIANGILTFWRRYTPFLVIGAIAGTIGVTMVHTLGADSRIGPWIGYEILIGMGVGITLQLPMIANQAAVGVEDIAAVTALTLFVENMGTAIFVASTEAAFTNGLVKALAHNTPDLKPEVVLNTGATRIRLSFGSDELYGILSSYLQGCQDSHFVPLACGASAVLVSMFIAVPAAAKELDSRVRKRA